MDIKYCYTSSRYGVACLQALNYISIPTLGDNIIIGSYDKRLCWIDMDLSTRSYKTLRLVCNEFNADNLCTIE